MAEDKKLTPEQIRDGHIKRFKQGVEVWNAWAEEMLREKEELEKAGKWNTSLEFDSKLAIAREVSSIPETQNWLNQAFVNFSALHFVAKNQVQSGEIEPAQPPDVKSISIDTETIDYSNFIFPGDANFYKATFTSLAYFSGATFTSLAYFSEATFTGDAYFYKATFTSLANFGEATFTGTADFSGATFTRLAYFSGATFTSLANFGEATFTSLANFGEATFTGTADFSGATFTRPASFGEATFTGDANFGEATFTSLAYFSGATFTSLAYFSEATFTGTADFSGATFTGSAHFTRADFKSQATFEDSKFKSMADFEAIKAERGFTLADTTFDAAVPDFIQAHFEEAPRLDHISVMPPPKYYQLNRLWHLAKRICQRHYLNLNEPQRIKWRLPRYNLVEWLRLRLRYSCRNFINHHRDPDEEARYRALKRLAIQAHDHENELKFFATELRARRHLTDSPNIFRHGPKSFLRYLAGIAYDIFSDFGRSIWRPFILFTVVFYAFTQLYIHQGTALTHGKCANSDKMDASYAAYTIAAKNSLLFLGTDRTDKIKRAYTCLYGASPIYEKANIQSGSPRFKTGYKNNVSTKRHMAPNVPWAVSVLGTAHSILSLILIFLLLLAIRNQFKIK